ncbi:exonuclease domain-containing protein [Pendulispora albinea]|uniref:3'-5' exonuclease n=1 Tax=Pendulispora albinea TaxID=2741071 RepID=A0ABZ2LXE7_9BACT
MVSRTRNNHPLFDPPPGPPWDEPPRDVPWAFLDLEMTGLDPSKDRVLEICIERVRGVDPDAEPEAVLETLILPGERALGNVHIHGIDREALAGAPLFDAVADRVLAILDGAVLVAHAAEWDVAFLEMELERAGRPIPPALMHPVDTLILARRAFAFQSYSLKNLAISMSIEHGQAHRAGPDVRAMRRVFERCVAELAPVSARDLWEVRVAARRARSAIVAACEEAVLHENTVLLTYRPSRRKPEPLLMVLTEIRADLDPPRVIGYQLPGRGRRELRADRILRIDPAPADPVAQ